jgi:PAS domain S-box-containing protein
MPVPRLRDDSHAFIVRLVDALRPLAAPGAVQAEATRLLGTYLGVNRSTYAEIDGDWAVLRGRYSDGVPPLPDRLPLAAFGGLIDEHRRGRMVAIDDVRTDARVSQSALAAFDAIHMRAFVTVVLIKDGRWVAAFGVDSATPRAWTEQERELIREVAERTWAAAEQARAEEALRESEARHRRLFETMDEGFAVGELVRDARGEPIDWRYLFVNAALERLSGLRPEDVVGRLGSEVFPDYRDWVPILAEVVDTQRPLRVERGSAAHGRVWLTRFYPYGGDRYASQYDDVTPRKQAEEALRTSATRQAYLLRLADALRPLHDAAAIQCEAACTLGEELHFDCVHYVELDEANDRMHVARAWVRPGARTIVGSYPYGPYDWIGPVFRRGECLVIDDVQTSPVIPDAARAAMAVFPARAFISAPLVKDGRLVAALSASVEEPRTWTPDEIGLVQETAERTWAAVERARAEAALQQANDALEQRVLDRTAQLAKSNAALECEVRERRHADRQIKALFRRLISTQEEERRRIARDIHDQVGQQMTALRMHLEALRARAQDDPAMGAQVERTQRLAEELDQSIDFLTWQLRPSTLDHLGLAASLQGLVQGWGERFGIDADFENSAPDMRLAADVETNLYRIAQEALHNVVKHAQAGTVSVLLSRRDHHAMLVIEDDGRGFEPEGPAAPQSAAGFGLVSMRERATLVGGELEIDSTPGSGTSIFVRVPLPAGPAAGGAAA